MPPTDRLTAVHIESYRAIADVRFEPDRSRTVLVGGNGAGKSSVMDAIALVGDLLRWEERALGGDLRGNVGGDDLGYSDLHHAFTDGPLRITLEFVLGVRAYSYALALQGDAERWFIAHEALSGPTLSGDGSDGEEALLAERTESGARARRRESDGQIRLLPVRSQRHVPVLQLGEDGDLYPELVAPRTFVRGLLALRPIPAMMRGWTPLGQWPDPYGRDLQARLHRLQTEKARVLGSFLDHMGSFVGWTDLATPSRDGRVRARFNEADRPSPLALATASDGSVLEAWLLTLAYDPPQGATVLLIDEPGTAFFERSHQRPAELLKLLSASRQIVVATHLPQLISVLGDPSRIWVAHREAGSGTRLERLPSNRTIEDVGLGEGALIAAEEIGRNSE